MIAYPISLQGFGTRVLKSGHGSIPVIFLHGVGSRADRWKNNLDLGDPRFTTFAIDFPGHGFAFKGSGFDYGISGYADFVQSFLNTLDGRRAILVGTSMGGHVAATVACREPERVRHLVLVGTTGMLSLDASITEGIAQRIVKTDREAIIGKLKTVLSNHSLVTEDLIDEEFAVNNSPGASESFSALAAYFRSGLNRDAVGERLASLSNRPPITLIWGDADRSIPVSTGRIVADLLGSKELHVMRSAGHAPYYEQPEQFRQLLTSEVLKREKE
jgi:pimeloyl-ACP methyl ester carboxylesterase